MNNELRDTLKRAKYAIGQASMLLEQADFAEKQSKSTSGDTAISAVAIILDGSVFMVICLVMLYIGKWLLTRFNILPLPLWAVILYIAVGFVAIPAVLIWLLHTRVFDREHAKNKALRKAEAENAAEAERKAREILSEYADAVSAIPAEYLYPDALAWMVHDVETGRSDSMKEVLNRYDEYMHRMRTEAAYAEIIAEQKRQTGLLKDVLSTARLNTAVTIYDAWKR